MITTTIAVEIFSSQLVDLTADLRRAGRPDLASEVAGWPSPSAGWTALDWAVQVEALTDVRTEAGGVYPLEHTICAARNAAECLREARMARAKGQLRPWRSLLEYAVA